MLSAWGTISSALRNFIWKQAGTATESGHSDYYVPYAFHFYGLIYARLMGEEDPERAGATGAGACLPAISFTGLPRRGGRSLWAQLDVPLCPVGVLVGRGLCRAGRVSSG